REPEQKIHQNTQARHPSCFLRFFLHPSAPASSPFSASHFPKQKKTEEKRIFSSNLSSKSTPLNPAEVKSRRNPHALAPAQPSRIPGSSPTPRPRFGWTGCRDPLILRLMVQSS
ncbi:hypothetical protein EJB05_43535, partial [Eragrostis curvula]